MRNKGFSIIEVMAAVAIVAGLGGALYRLQLSSLSVSQQVVTRQLLAMYTDDLASKMITQTNFVSTQREDNAMTSIHIEPGTFGTHQNAYVDEVTTSADCDHQMCNDMQLSTFYLAQWRANIENEVHLQEINYRLDVCRDFKMGIPKFDKDDPYAYQDNCADGEFDPIIIKVSWADQNESSDTQFLTRDDNYMLFRVPGR